ncbi:hypothetical protein [Mycobacteroides abscessus]|uniref:hypothetical protein n=2 Tax=Mycobacteroides abscessus TaxID=36809 RepID=UPI000241C31C|nr:hypothetical protein [Mycobacteroides abscessus]EHM19820.1 hypothetical protein MMAS_11050 [Mycobacteroides abscessus subsp. massiliense CCUG 48898 = JCM 15300]AMU64879.1 hypothetical protein A3O04_05960 [Mycobacteroides abscessus]ANO13438.1 hypothetical protein BAB77_05840 [Mycobacteroides abscessus]ARQ63679.1 hypothetical protein CAK77_05860 [Mycobacteroides abscessus subsp. massiliense]EIV67661.1 hypothetical protein MMCCUG48898_0993 [Mycobacteroides abscessus subsp. massiliense CCUG 488
MDLDALLAEVEELEAQAKNVTEAKKKPSVATQLVRLAEAQYGFGITPNGKTFAYHLEAPHVTFPLKSKQLALQQRLAWDYYERNQIVAAASALGEAMVTLEGIALRTEPAETYVRVAGDSEAVYLDMADAANRVIKISGGDWKVVTECPYKFRRTQDTAAMVEPARGGKVSRLFRYVPVARDERALVVGTAVDFIINPNTAKPIVHLDGEQGTAKTSSTVHFARLIDPAVTPHNSPPKSLQDWILTAATSWVVALDNLSDLPFWLSDAMCRTATGSGLKTRALYTDEDLALFVFRRPIVFNGISMEHIRGDLADRLVPFTLQHIPEDKRVPEGDLAAEWSKDHPRILGGLLSIAAKVHHKLPHTPRPDKLPRMADFALTLNCFDQEFNHNPKSLPLYLSRRKRALTETAQDDPFIAQLVAMRYDTGLDGHTGKEVLEAVTAAYRVDPPPKGWPKHPKTVTHLLTRHAPGLRAAGWSVENDGGKNKDSTKRWILVPPAEDDEKAGTE